MARIEIYTTPLCGYCHAAKRLLAKKGVEFEEINLMTSPNKRGEMIDRAGGRGTVPQIFIDGVHIGGSDELHELDFDGELDPMLAS